MRTQTTNYPKASKTLWRILGIGFLLGLFAAPNFAKADGLTCSVMPQLFELFMKRHYSVHTLTDTLKSHTVDQFIKMTDPSKSLFLASDVAKLKPDLKSSFEGMKTGDCSKLTAVSELLVKRSKENEKFVRDFLGDNYKLDENTEFVFDPEMRDFPKTEKDRNELIKKMIHFQISTYLTSDTKLPEAKKNLIHRYELITKRFQEEKLEDVLNTFAEGFAVSLDPHSSYLSRDSLADFQITMQLSLEGIGAQLMNQDGFTVIEELIPGGSADRSKQLMPKDKIMAVAQDGGKPVSVMDMDLRDVVKMIRGKKGTKVILTILRQAEKAKTFEVSITRDKIDMKDQAAKIFFQTRKVGDKTYKIGVLDLPSFYGDGRGTGRSCYRDMKELLVKANNEKVDGLVLDLSANGGGLLEEAVQIAGLFLKRGAIVATKSNGDRVEALEDDDPATVYSGPLMVLISRGSASASEIVAGALKDYHRALIVGSDHTFGKGSVQAVNDLPFNLGAMKVTTGMFFRPSGNSTQHSGVKSDVTLPSLASTDKIGENTLDYSLPPQSIPAFLSTDVDDSAKGAHWKPVDASEVKSLDEKAQGRVAKNPKFQEILKNLEETKRNHGIIRLAETRKKELEESQEEKKKKEHHQLGEYDMEQPLVQEGLNIMADYIPLAGQ